jgi:Na+/H+ antiporter NhaD/arsenite permease-like protein
LTSEDAGGPVGTARDAVIYIVAVAFVGAVLWLMLGNFKQTMAGTIFIATVIGTLMFWRFRLAIAFVGISALLATSTLDITEMIQFMNIDVICFLIGMMILVDIAKESGLFIWILDKLLKATKYDPRKVLIVLLAMSTLMAAMVDEVTSILFIIAIIFEYCKYFDIDPLPYVISAVLATNVGSSATVLGNPIGILIALRGSLTFVDFLMWATPVALMSLLLLIAILPLWYRKPLAEAKVKVLAKMNGATSADVLETIGQDRMKDVKISGVILFGTIFFIALHAQLEPIFGLEKDTLLLVFSFLGAAAGLFWKRATARQIVERGVDWWSLVFFMFLFAKAGALKFTGLTDRLASGIASVARSQVQIQSIVLWLACGASSVLDNVVLVAALIPVVQSLVAIGYKSTPLSFALLFGGVYGGNITMIGSTANIVALGMLEKKFNYHMKFFKWLWVGILGGVLPTLVAQVWLTAFFH